MSRIATIFLVVIAPLLALVLALLGLETLHSNPLGWFLLLVGVVYVAGVVIVFYIRKEQFWGSTSGGATTHEERGDRSYWLIVVGMMAAFYLPPIEYIYFNAAIPRVLFLKVSGVILLISGILLFIWARRILGGSYSGHLSVTEGQSLVQRGPYQWIRHPAYTGYLLMALGLSLGYSSLVGLAAVVFLLLPTLVYRIQTEEKILIQQFGKTYQQYIRTTRALIPGLW